MAKIWTSKSQAKKMNKQEDDIHKLFANSDFRAYLTSTTSNQPCNKFKSIQY